MLAINIKVGMSTHVAEGTLHKFPSESISKTREFGSSPPSCTRNGGKAKESSNEVYARTSYAETQN